MNDPRWPCFNTLDPQRVLSDTHRLIDDCQKTIDDLAHHTDSPSWDNFAAFIEDLEQHIEEFWSPISHLNAVMSTEEWRRAYNEAHPLIVQFFAQLGQNKKLYTKYCAIRESSAHNTLSAAQKRLLDLSIAHFELSGVHLPPQEKEALLQIESDLAQKQNSFSENHLDSTNVYSLFVSDSEKLLGIPQDILDRAQEKALSEKQEGWSFTLQAPCFGPVMSWAENRSLRNTLYRAYTTQASELFAEYGHASNQWDNTNNIHEIMALRQKKATLLGFDNYASYSLALKMASSCHEVTDFLKTLVDRVKPQGQKDWDELKKFAREQKNLDQVEPWDISYLSEQLKLHQFNLDSEEVRQYFPYQKTVDGLFWLVKTLFEIEIKIVSAPTYHKDVVAYELFDPIGGKKVGFFYLDPFSRENKRSGAWVDACRTRHKKKNGDTELPIAYVVCNFPPHTKDKPSYLSHDDVLTLFHEFGHALHHLLTSIDHHSISGFNGIEWDAVELPSQFMENFAWEYDILKKISSHRDTKEPLPADLYKRMVDAKNFHVGLFWLRQLEFSSFDFHIHEHWTTEPPMNVLSELSAIREKIAVIIPPHWNRFPMIFDHIFATSAYAAGYYSYKWAEVLSADAFEAFKESGSVINKELGKRFRQEILEQGASRPMAESFLAFRKRKPEINALLKHNGIAPLEQKKD